MTADERAPAAVTGSPDELRGRLIYVWGPHPRVMPDQETARRIIRRSMAFLAIAVVAVGIAAYLFGARGFTYGTIAAIIASISLHRYTTRTLPVAINVAPLWQQTAHVMPNAFFIGGMIWYVFSIAGFAMSMYAVISLMDGDYIDFLRALGPLDILILIHLAVLSFGPIIFAMYRFKRHHRHMKTPPGVVTPPRVPPKDLKKVSSWRHVMATMFLIFMPVLHEIGKVWSALTTDSDYFFDGDSLMNLSLVCAGLFASLIVWTTLRPLRRVRYYEVVSILVLTWLAGTIGLLAVFFGIEDIWQFATSETTANLALAYFFFGSAFWLFAFYRNELYFPRPETA